MALNLSYRLQPCGVLFLIWIVYSLDQQRYHPDTFFYYTTEFVQVSRFNLDFLYFNEHLLPSSLIPFG